MSQHDRSGQLRIIGGQWRHRKISFPAVEGLRPTPDRIRETLFNWLQPYIAGAHCLDLFTGSGALGMEALSRGASTVAMVDQNGRLLSHIRDELDRLGAAPAQARLVHSDALTFLRGPPQAFDIVFVDPPFTSELVTPCCRLLDEKAWLAPGARIYVETAKTPAPPDLPAGWRVLKHKRAGQVDFYLAGVDGD